MFLIGFTIRVLASSYRSLCSSAGGSRGVRGAILEGLQSDSGIKSDVQVGLFCNWCRGSLQAKWVSWLLSRLCLYRTVGRGVWETGGKLRFSLLEICCFFLTWADPQPPAPKIRQPRGAKAPPWMSTQRRSRWDQYEKQIVITNKG